MHSSSYPLISVVMSVYNGEKHLAEAIDSVLSQSYTNFEFIIINDGSTDKSIEIINNYINKDNRIVLIDRENKGLPYSLNEGIAKSKGDYIARMDADDICLPERFNKQIRYLIQQNLDVCGTYIETFEGNKSKYILTNPVNHNDIKFQLLFTTAFAHPTVMLRKEVFDKVQYNSTYKVAQDYQLWIDIISSGFRAGNLPEVLLKYRKHEEQASFIKLKLQKDTAREIRESSYKHLNPEAAPIVSNYFKLKDKSKVNLKDFYLSLYEINKLGKKMEVSDEFMVAVLRQICNQFPPKTPIRYLFYRKISRQYKKDSMAEFKMLIKSVIGDSDSKAFKVLQRAGRKLNL